MKKHFKEKHFWHDHKIKGRVWWTMQTLSHHYYFMGIKCSESLGQASQLVRQLITWRQGLPIIPYYFGHAC
jgi:hypothetical protein